MMSCDPPSAAGRRISSKERCLRAEDHRSSVLCKHYIFSFGVVDDATCSETCENTIVGKKAMRKEIRQTFQRSWMRLVKMREIDETEAEPQSLFIAHATTASRPWPAGVAG